MEETSKKAISFTRASATQLSSNDSLPKPGTLKGEEVESAKAEMSQVREENTRLKMMLQKIESEYKTLKMLVEDNNFQQENTTTGGSGGNNEVVSSVEEPDPEHELISLCLGTKRNIPKNKEENIGEILKKKNGNIGLRLGLDNYDDKSKYEVAFLNLNSSGDNGLLSAENKEEDGGEKWVTNKGLKTIRNVDEDEVSQVNNVKRARVSVRARCSTPTMNDGCQWRKYGQKIAKSNPCPRAYYRCTVAASCPVRKQVQRCAEDTSILVTTYEGTHNHPLPLSATAMASTTSAAASMLLSGSSSSPPQGLGPTVAVAAAPNLTNTTFHGYNINMPNNNSNTHPFYMSNPSTSPPFPTITLDLTAPPSTTSSPFNVAATNFQSNGHGLFPFTGFGFSNPYSNVLGNLDYGTTPFSNRTQNIGSLFQSPMQKRPELMSAAATATASSSQQALTETLTRAITSDPNFRSVIAAAISKMNGGSGSSVHQANSTVESLGRNLKWDVDQEKSPVRIPSPAAHQAI